MGCRPEFALDFVLFAKRSTLGRTHLGAKARRAAVPEEAAGLRCISPRCMLGCHRLLTGELEYWVVVVVVEGGGGRVREEEALGPSRRGGGEQAGRQAEWG